MEQLEPQQCEVWPDHWLAVQTFALCMGQLRTGPGGPLGLDYAVVLPVMDRLRIKPRRQIVVLKQVGVMEDELLAFIRRRA